jgi:hypothetical protein
VSHTKAWRTLPENAHEGLPIFRELKARVLLRFENQNGLSRLSRMESATQFPDQGQSGMQAVTVISTRRSGEFNITSTVVLAGLLVGKNLAYSSL